MFVKSCENCGEETSREKASEANRKNWRFCSRSCATIWTNKNRKLPFLEQICNYCKGKFYGNTKRRLRRKYCSKKCFITAINKLPWHKALTPKGERHYFWRGGKSLLRLQNTPAWREWRKKVFERDDYTCQICKVKGGRLQPDHIKPVALYPKLVFDVNNGRTLCMPCHRKTETYGLKLVWAIRKSLKVATTI